jgi:Glycosyltransferase Family 4
VSPTVLFVGHAADRTGPPIGLLHLARWLHAQGEVTLEFLVLEAGPLLPDYEALGTTVVLEEWRLDGPWGALATLAEGRAHRLLPGVRRRALARRLRPLTPPDLVYVNTAWTIRALRHLPFPVPALVVAIHELEVGLDLHLPPEEHEVLFGRPDHLIAVSEAVRENAVSHHGVDPADVSVHYEMIEVRPPDPEGSAGIRTPWWWARPG